MKITDDLVDRLFRAAVSIPWEEPGRPPFALEARILAAWRASHPGGELAGLMRLFRIGLGFASALMALIIALSLRDIAKETRDQQLLPNVTVNLALSE